MSNEHGSLDAAATERKARLARLALLKRKRDNPIDESTQNDGTNVSDEAPTSVTQKYVSGRNFDIATNAPKLGFEQQPPTQNDTVEDVANRLVSIANEQAAKDETEAANGIDLFKLQPKKPNWDLKRDLSERMKLVDIKTQNAIARLVRERIQQAKQEAMTKDGGQNDGEGQELGVEGNILVQAVHLREQEEEERKVEAEDEETDTS